MNKPDDVERMDVLREQAERLLASDALGRSQALEKLFQFILACSLEGRSPKELEIADEVFGRTVASADQDASIRVHIHRLRRKLEEYYAGPGAGEAWHLTIPRGGYRLVAEPAPAAAAIETAERPAKVIQIPVPSGRYLALAGIVLGLFIAGMLVLLYMNRPGAVDVAVARVQASILWKSAASNERPVYIVVGDYYIFGERTEDGQITRLVRQFDVNSPRDLEAITEGQPELANRYVDLGLNYLPVGVGNALRRVIPVVTRDRNSLITMRVVPASRLTPDMLKFNDIVYLGYLSGLGPLRDPVFRRSRFAIGTYYDEIVDKKTGRHYVADTHLNKDNSKPSRDYAILSTFTGVTGNRLVIIAGTRDAALMQAAEYATRSAMVEEVTDRVKDAASFEALLKVDSLDNEGLGAALVAASPRSNDVAWTGGRPQVFPDNFEKTMTAGANAH